jgi:hypothetical protein
MIDSNPWNLFHVRCNNFTAISLTPSVKYWNAVHTKCNGHPNKLKDSSVKI